MNDQNTQTRSGDNAIITGVIWKQLMIFFFPLLVGTFFQFLYNTVDAIVVGQFVGKEALSAVGGAPATLINVYIGIFTGISTGASVIVAQFCGAGRKAEVSKTVHTSMAIALIGGVILTVVMFFFSGIMLRAMSTPDELMAQSVLYMQIFALGMIGNMVYNFCAAILRGAGNSRQPFYFLVAGTLTNIVLDLVMVAVLGWGVAGAAWATIISQYVSAIAAVVYLVNIKGDYLHLDLRRIRIDRDIFRKIMVIGIPSALRSLMYSMTNVVIQAAINGFGTDTVAAWTVWGKIDALFWMIINSLGVAVTTFIGQNYGAGKYARVRKCLRQALFITTLFTLVMIMVFVTFGDTLIRIFTNDAGVITIATAILDFMAPTFITYICIEIFASALQGMGDVLVPTIITIVGVCVIRIAWLYTVVPLVHTLNSVMFSYPISWIISSAAFVIYYLWFIKKRKMTIR